MKNIKALDQEEKDLEKALKSNKWESISSIKKVSKYQEFARNSLNKNKRINIRINERDLHKIQSKAVHEGIPYQSLISMLIHKFNEGRLVLKN